MLNQQAEPTNKKIVFFSVNFGRTVRDMVAVYDKRDISDVEALSLIKAEEYSPKVIVITKEQFDNVFRDIIDTPMQKGRENRP